MRAVMASIKVIVPPGVRVIVDAHSVMASVQSRADEASSTLPAASSEPVIRLTGYAFMADVNVVVRRREDALILDEDEDRRLAPCRYGPTRRYVVSYRSIDSVITRIATSLFSQPRIWTRFPSRSLYVEKKYSTSFNTWRGMSAMSKNSS